MFPRLSRGAAVAALSLTLMVACDKDEVLGPPDVAACTSGALTVGETTTGALDESSCLLWYDGIFDVTPAESWSFRTAANTAYIVRLRPIADADGTSELDADLQLFGRSENGDAHFATGSWRSFAFSDDDDVDLFGQELIFSTLTAQTVSIRVQANDDESLGAYELELLSCAMVAVAPGTASAPVALTDDCELLSEAAPGVPGRVAFFSFVTGQGEEPELRVTRTGGEASMQVRVNGPGLDGSCWSNRCPSASTITGAGPFDLEPEITVAGYYTVMVLQRTAGSLTASVRVFR
jgi:hypothetical protein